MDPEKQRRKRIGALISCIGGSIFVLGALAAIWVILTGKTAWYFDLIFRLRHRWLS